MLRTLLIALLIGGFGVNDLLAQQKLYRWKDASGRIVYTDQRPPTDAREVEQRQLGDRPGTAGLPYAVQQAMKAFPVTLFTADCGDPCNSARQLLEKRGVPFSEKDARMEEVQAAIKKLGGPKDVEVPILVVGRSLARGWDETRWSAMLDEAGYPRTAWRSSKPDGGAFRRKASSENTRSPSESAEPKPEKSGARLEKAPQAKTPAQTP